MKTNTQKLPTARLILKTKTSLLALLGVVLTLAYPGHAIEDPPGCSFPSGEGTRSELGLNFAQPEAHVGDTVTLFPKAGMVANACRAVNVYGTLHVSTGILTNFLVDATLDPGVPARNSCNLLITPDLVGAGVSSLRGNVAGRLGEVRALSIVEGSVVSSATEQLYGFHTASLRIVKPDLQVVQQFAFPSGQTCFRTGQEIVCTGYVTNCGDITLTNVVLDCQAGPVELYHQTTGQRFPANVILPPGECAMFTHRFTPTVQETTPRRATMLTTATARDTTTIGGPNAFVTKSVTSVCAICDEPPILSEPVFTADHRFQFKVTGTAGTRYVIQATTSLTVRNWVSLGTNTGSFLFVDSNALLYPARIYRAVTFPGL